MTTLSPLSMRFEISGLEFYVFCLKGTPCLIVLIFWIFLSSLREIVNYVFLTVLGLHLIGAFSSIFVSLKESSHYLRSKEVTYFLEAPNCVSQA